MMTYGLELRHKVEGVWSAWRAMTSAPTNLSREMAERLADALNRDGASVRVVEYQTDADPTGVRIAQRIRIA